MRILIGRGIRKRRASCTAASLVLRADDRLASGYRAPITHGALLLQGVDRPILRIELIWCAWRAQNGCAVGGALVVLGVGFAFAALFSYFIRYSRVDSLIGSIESDLYLRLSQMFAAEKALLTLGGIAFSAGVVLAIVGAVRFRRHTAVR